MSRKPDYVTHGHATVTGGEGSRGKKMVMGKGGLDAWEWGQEITYQDPDSVIGKNKCCFLSIQMPNQVN